MEHFLQGVTLTLPPGSVPSHAADRWEVRLTFVDWANGGDQRRRVSAPLVWRPWAGRYPGPLRRQVRDGQEWVAQRAYFYEVNRSVAVDPYLGSVGFTAYGQHFEVWWLPGNPADPVVSE